MPAARARLTVDLDALAANYAFLRAKAGAAETAPVVKADGYGLGAGAVSRRLWAEGARSFHVARLEEGEALRADLGPDRAAAIYVLDGATAGSAARLIAASLIPVLNSPAQLETYSAMARASTPLICAVHIDTGMNRLGFRPEEIAALVEASDRLDRLEIALVMSHLACADREEDRLNARQLGRLRQALRLLPDIRASLANTAAIFLGPDYHMDMVRPGIGLYGGGPFGKPHRDIRPVASFEAPILDVRAVSAGETVGYGGEFVADRPLRIAVVAAGYADGLLRSGWPGGEVWFAGERRRLAGRISMDLITVDVTGCEAAQPGAMVELFGRNLPIDDVAEAARTNAYEILTRLGSRAERVYIGAID